MKHFLAISTMMLLANLVCGQQEKVSYKAAAHTLESQYNTGNFDAIFESFAPDMKKALPLEQTKGFFTGLKQQAGSITQREFVRYEQTYAVYKTTFEKGIFALYLSIDNNAKINGLLFKPYQDTQSPNMERNKTSMILPCKGEWFVFWGGDTEELNYHVSHAAQKNAFDLIMTNEKGNSFRTDGKTNEDYYAFGQELIAPCDGEIVLAVDGVKDNVPGTMNPFFPLGNAVFIKTANGEYIVLAHFKQHSIVVKQGQRVKQGQLLGLCGNSGNSSEAHLHFHLQNVEDINTATGIKCYFNNIAVNGQLQKDYSPIQSEKVKNL